MDTATLPGNNETQLLTLHKQQELAIKCEPYWVAESEELPTLHEQQELSIKCEPYWVAESEEEPLHTSEHKCDPLIQIWMKTEQGTIDTLSKGLSAVGDPESNTSLLQNQGIKIEEGSNFRKVIESRNDYSLEGTLEDVEPYNGFICNGAPMPEPPPRKRRKRCKYCPSRADRKTNTECYCCKVMVCRQHTIPVCYKCTERVICDRQRILDTLNWYNGFFTNGLPLLGPSPKKHRKRCKYCPSRADRKTNTECFCCRVMVCRQHITPVCYKCTKSATCDREKLLDTLT